MTQESCRIYRRVSAGRVHRRRRCSASYDDEDLGMSRGLTTLYPLDCSDIPFQPVLGYSQEHDLMSDFSSTIPALSSEQPATPRPLIPSCAGDLDEGAEDDEAGAVEPNIRFQCDIYQPQCTIPAQNTLTHHLSAAEFTTGCSAQHSQTSMANELLYVQQPQEIQPQRPLEIAWSRHERQQRHRRRRQRRRSRQHQRRRATHCRRVIEDDTYIKPPCCSSLGCKICLSLCTQFKKVLVFFASFGTICVLLGIVLGVLRSPGNSFFTLSLMFVGLGLILLGLVLIGWKCTPADHEPCHMLFGLGTYSRVSRRGRRRRERLYWLGEMLYPEFRHRRPPPSYAAAMHEYRHEQRMLQSSAYIPQSPPPSYKQRSAVQRPGIHIIFPREDHLPSSNPPTYRLINNIQRPSILCSSNPGAMHVNHNRLCLSQASVVSPRDLEYPSDGAIPHYAYVNQSYSNSSSSIEPGETLTLTQEQQTDETVSSSPNIQPTNTGYIPVTNQTTNTGYIGLPVTNQTTNTGYIPVTNQPTSNTPTTIQASQMLDIINNTTFSSNL